MDRIKDLSLDQKAKLYYMGLVRKGEIDTLPEDPKAAFVRDMMDRKDEFKEIATELGYLKENEPTVFDDESMGKLLNIILKYVEDPDDAEVELDRFDNGGFDAMSDMVTANLLRDPEYKAWYNKLHSIQEEVDGMEGGIDLNAVSYEKVTFIYTEQGGRFYGLDVYENKDQPQRSAKLRYDEANEWLKDTLAYIHEGDLIPKSYNSGLEDLDLIVARLKELGIEASHGDYMDVS
ncbi:hypothetical protein N9Z72_00180 [Akkermansiaceae bacterium]|nr:hypothetical protein [Akkermansiaceae bacterium]